MDFKQAVLAVTENPKVLERLRKLSRVQTDPKTGKEFVWGQFDGQSIPFYLGEPRTLPLNVAEGIERDNTTHLVEKCKHCAGRGSTVAGICTQCHGVGEQHLPPIYRVFKVLRRFDAMLIEPESIPAPSPAQEPEKAARPEPVSAT